MQRIVAEKLPLSKHAMMMPMRYLGIDYGSKKVGLALSDESGSMAFPHSVVPNDKLFRSTLSRLVEAEHVDEIVIGHSQNRDGSDNDIQEAINELITDITLEFGIPVHLESEVYTTREAERLQGKHDKIDASAAAIILNSYLKKQ